MEKVKDRGNMINGELLERLERIEMKLAEMLQFQVGNYGDKTVLTVDELAEYTNLKRSHIYKLTSSRSIPFSKPNGKVIYFNKKEIDDWLMGKRVSTTRDIELKANTYVAISRPIRK